MPYLDTSVVVTMLTVEPDTSTIAVSISAIKNLCISDWVITEFASALSLKSRVGSMLDSERREAHDAFAQLVEASLSVLSVSRTDFATAAHLCEDPAAGLRSGDALHLAIASAHGLTMITRDRDMARAARQLGLPTTLMQEIS